MLSALFYLSAVLVWVRFVETPRPARYALAMGLFTAGLLSKSVVVTLPAGKLPDGYRRGALGLAAAAAVVLGVLTWRQAGVYRDEVTLFSHVVTHNPETRDAHLNLGSALIEAGRNEEGLAASRIAVEQRPDSDGALANVGRALIHFEQLEVLAIDEEFALAYAGMGTALFGAGRYVQALDTMATALALEPEIPAAAMLHLHMGRAARELGRLQEAAAHLERSTEIDADNVEPLLNLANLRIEQGRSEEADQILRGLRESRTGDPATLHNVAEALRAQGRYAKAIASYRAALHVDAEFAPAYDPRDREALDHLAMARFGQQRYEEALALYRTMVEMDPDNAITHSNLAATLYHFEADGRSTGQYRTGARPRARAGSRRGRPAAGAQKH